MSTFCLKRIQHTAQLTFKINLKKMLDNYFKYSNSLTTQANNTIIFVGMTPTISVITGEENVITVYSI